MNTMKAAVLHKAGDLRFQETAVPETGPGDLLVRVRMNGICGSDIHFYREGRLGPFTVSEPYIPGHEACGVVAAAAEEGGAAAPGVGQRVAIEPGIPCRRCDLCKSGRYNLCTDVRFLSAPPENGTFAEFVSVPWDFAHPLPDSVDDVCGAFVEPISVGVQACERAKLSAGASVAILGAGPIGLTLSLVARSYGATEIYLVDVLNRRLDLARSIGADGAFNADAGDPVGEIRERSGGGVDVVFDTSGSSAAAASTTKYAARGGVVVLVGWPEVPAFSFPVEEVLEMELDVRGVNRYCNTYPKAISLLASELIDPRPLVSHRFTLEEVVRAFDLASTRREETVKVMISS
jgi:L-iditol 2-dehydrogenase